MEVIRQQVYVGERPLFHGSDLELHDTIFTDGESPLKESRNIRLFNSMFQWKYPLWYAKDIYAKDCTWLEMARSGVWYTDNITLEDCVLDAPKNFRRCHGVTLKNVSFSQAAETLWTCEDVSLDRVTAKGDYFGMNSRRLQIRDFTLYGNYAFDGASDIEVHHAKMLSKDAFWNTQNVTIYDSFLSGEYLGWNSKNLTFVNCTIESLQGLCYIENLTLKNCRLLNTTLSFEYTTTDAEIMGRVESVFNPSGGIIRADEIGELTMDPQRIDPSKTVILTGDAVKKRNPA